MARRSLWLSLFASLVTALVAFQGCSASSSTKFSNSNGTSTSTGSTTGGGDCLLCGTGGGTGGDNQAGVILIEPATTVLTVKDGVIPTQQFKATLNGADVTNQVTWVVEKPDTASIGKNGLLQPTGKVGGVTKVIALYDKSKGEALATISVELVVNTANVGASDKTLLDNAVQSDPGFQFTYPLDKVVMPLRVLSPEFMWQSNKSAQYYRLKLSSKHMSYVEYFTAGNPGLKALAQKQWEDIQFSGTGPVSDPLKVELSRLSNGVADAAKPISIGIAQGIVYGSVYYWQLPYGSGNGKILRIKPSAEVTDEFFPSPHCFGCHSVSRDGTKMMATFEMGSFNGFPQQIIDLSQNPAQLGTIQAGTGLTGVFSTFNNDGSKVAYSDNYSGSPTADQSAVHIVDAVSGAKILQNALPPGCGEPTWSPDGTMLAGICGLTGYGWTFDSYTGDLTVAQLNPSQNQVVASKIVVTKGNLQGRPAYPTFTPDSKFIVYGRPDQGSRSSGNGTLWMTDVAGQNVVQLVNASNDNQSFNPVFAPKSAGGYTWLVFISKRNYGHKLVNSGRQQLWMVALDDPPMPGQDPSHPPFYLRGQDSQQLSENAYYALDPCKKDGESCEHGIECCNKSCIYDEGQMKHICKPAEGGDCIPTGSGPCKTDVDCCDFADDVVCLNGFCELKPPK